MDLSRFPVNKGTNSRLRWAKYSDLYEIVHPSLVLISLCLFTGAECGKGLLDRRKAKADGALNILLPPPFYHCCRTLTNCANPCSLK